MYKKEDLYGFDMLVRLYDLPEAKTADGIRIKRGLICDREDILAFVRQHFSERWAAEAERALMQEVSKCFVAVEDGCVVGFACFDGAARGYFGPIGVAPEQRGKKIGEALLLTTLHAMREYGYGYAVIGWVNEATGFYEKTAGAIKIPDSSPEKGVFRNLLEA